MLDAISHARDVRARLRNPPNAVPDYGIDLKRGPKPIVEAASVAPLMHVEPVPRHVVIRAEIRWLTDELNARRDELRSLGIIGITIEDVQSAVCCFCPVSMTDLKSIRRTGDVVLPRQIAMWLAKKHTEKTLVQIGRAFGNRDHTTAMHACRKIESLVKTNPEIAGLVQKVEAQLLATGK